MCPVTVIGSRDRHVNGGASMRCNTCSMQATGEGEGEGEGEEGVIVTAE